MYSPTENPLSAYRRFRAQTAFIERLRIQSGLLALAVIINILILYLLQTAGVWLLRGWFRSSSLLTQSMSFLQSFFI